MYLEILKRIGAKPNFWTSREYFEKANWRETSFLQWYWIEDDTGQVMLPPVHSYSRDLSTCLPMGVGSVWSDFEGYSPSNSSCEFLDWEFIYHRPWFLEMKGKTWMKFRKNSRKWPRNRTKLRYSEAMPRAGELERVAIEWLEGFMGQKLYDPRVIAKYIFHGEHRKFLYENDRLVGANIWDKNHMYDNYRLCVHVKEPFLDEFLRFLMMTDQFQHTLQVNDGGSLDSEGLRRFKESLNPIRMRPVFSWKLKS